MEKSIAQSGGTSVSGKVHHRGEYQRICTVHAAEEPHPQPRDRSFSSPLHDGLALLPPGEPAAAAQPQSPARQPGSVGRHHPRPPVGFLLHQRAHGQGGACRRERVQSHFKHTSAAMADAEIKGCCRSKRLTPPTPAYEQQGGWGFNEGS